MVGRRAEAFLRLDSRCDFALQFGALHFETESVAPSVVDDVERAEDRKGEYPDAQTYTDAPSDDLPNLGSNGVV